ncbi:hypothetical protein F4824DRAFT_498134 [Ustulina deusta]|nr:hypothetical protein F4824DRAFT_498134 [Ustulina deusta]
MRETITKLPISSYRCREQGCGIVFASQQQLRTHKREYHLNETDWVIKRKNRPSESTNDEHEHPDNQLEEQLTPAYLMHWHRGSNINFIRQKATAMVLRTTKSELHGIIERMTQGLKDQLSREQIEPLPYHFRRAAVKDFKANQGRCLARRYNVEPENTDKAVYEECNFPYTT